MRTYAATCDGCGTSAEVAASVRATWLFCRVHAAVPRHPDGWVRLCAECKRTHTAADVQQLGNADSEALLADWAHREAMAALGWPEATT